jgi:phosphatidylinositol alpha-mannosyltransferase
VPGAVRAGHEGRLVCPHSWDGPGGVQEHIKDLAEALMDLVHEVSVISPAGDELPPDHVVPTSRAVPVPRNGAGRSPSRLPGRSGC